MEASESGTAPEEPGRDPAAPAPETQDPGAAGGDSEEGGQAVEGASSDTPPADSEERNPAEEQSPAATAAEDTIIGDPGLRDEQQPVAAVGSQDIPARTSPPPPSAQSGVPLPEDRAAGVQPGTPGPVVPAREDEDEAPEHDGSEGQSTTPPLGG